MSKGLDVTVLENKALSLTCSLDCDLDHGPGQVIGPNHQAGEHHPKR
jgi:hypothetical protein